MGQNNGFLLLDKPAGISSYQALRPVKKEFHKHKIGFAGTLDPAATGLLVIAVGKSTRLLRYIEDFPKVYTFEVLLGQRTDTYDTEGTVLESGSTDHVTATKVEEALHSFRGLITQTPPAYSAVKIRGKRACDRVRAGEKVELKPKSVTVHKLVMHAFSQNRLRLELHCSRGTYVRTLADDLGRKLGCFGTACNIRRDAVGHLRVEDAASPETDNYTQWLLEPSSVLTGIPKVTVSEKALYEIAQGRPLSRNEFVWSPSEEGHTEPQDPVQALDKSGQLVAITTLNPYGMLCPKIVLLPG